MNKCRLDQYLSNNKLVASRSQAESYIRLGAVKVNGRVTTKTGYMVGENDKIELIQTEQYVSRAGLKLASVAADFGLDFRGKVVLDVGSSTGGFTDYALQHGAEKVIAVDVGTDQLHPSLRTNPKVNLHEKTDIRSVRKFSASPDVVVIDVSFISLREVLPHISKLMTRKSLLVAMVKPQFEAQLSSIKHKGIVKNEAMRRTILKDFEQWCKQHFIIQNKQDSAVAGEKGNTERFYLLRKL